MAKPRKLKRPGSDRRYDLDMIRDFIEHLTWELRIGYHESQHSEINPELVDQLEKYTKKRQTSGLLFATGVREDLDPEQLAKLRELIGELRRNQLMLLEALSHSLFPEAFDAARNGKQLSILEFDTYADAIRHHGRGRDIVDTGSPE